ncbi:MAG TPA: hypothetical protein VF432_11385 [Thermoanaerobaculia bacterium]
MRKKFAALIALALLGLPISANALETDELIALTAMPLVVAAAAELTDVPTSELMNVVSTLNNAQVRPTQFVEVVRYAPIAIVSPAEPRFTTYVTTEYARGVVGEPLALSIADQYPAYGVEEEIHIVDPPVVTYVERREYLPQVVVTRFEPQPFDPLALVAMPLAVAAVSEVTDVPAGDLISFITALNRARMPAPQFVEVVRYSPVVLVDTTERPLFLRYVTTEIDRGVIGRPLAFALADRIGIEDLVDDIGEPRIVFDRDFDDDRDVFLPAVVTTRVATMRAHPHGGPPGQLKKERGLQTGAEVVHGTPRRSSAQRSTARVARDRDDDRKAPKKAKVRQVRSDGDRGKARVTRNVSGGKDRGPRVKAERVKPSQVSRPSKSNGGGKSRVAKPQGSKGHGGGGGGGGKGHGGGNSGGGKGKGKGKG